MPTSPSAALPEDHNQYAEPTMAIKKSTKHRDTPVIMLSSKDSLFDRARGRMVGSDEYLTKPFTKESLLKAVEAHLAQKSPA